LITKSQAVYLLIEINLTSSISFDLITKSFFRHELLSKVWKPDSRWYSITSKDNIWSSHDIRRFENWLMLPSSVVETGWRWQNHEAGGYHTKVSIAISEGVST